jgi:hypothetical protein
MAGNEFKDVLRVEAWGATGVKDILRNKQVGFEVDGTYRQGRKTAAGNMVWWTPDGYQYATGILYSNLDYPTVGNVAEGLDMALTGASGATGVQGIQGETGIIGNTGAQGLTGAAGIGSTGLAHNMLTRVAADGTLINSTFSNWDAPTGPYGEYEGNIFKTRRTTGSAQYNPAELRIIRDTGVGQAHFEMTRLSFIGQDSAGSLQNYGSIRGYCVDPTDGNEAGTVSISVGDSDAESERMKITRFAGVQIVNGSSLAIGDSYLEWTTNQCIAFGIPTGAQSGSWENEEIGMAGRAFTTDITDGGMTVEGLSNKTSADTALSLIGRCVTTPGSAGAVSVDCCSQAGATATGINNDSAIAVFKNGGTVQPNVTIWGDGDIGDRYEDIFAQCTFGNGLTAMSGYVGVKKIGRTAFFNVWLSGFHTGPLTKTMELPEAYRACTGMPQAFFTHACSNDATWGHGCGYMSSYLEKKIYLTSTANPNQGLWSGGAFASQFSFFTECQV